MNDDVVTQPITVPPHVRLTDGGPYLVRGCPVFDKDGSVVKIGDCALCACGKSANKPFCDGAHAK